MTSDRGGIAICANEGPSRVRWTWPWTQTGSQLWELNSRWCILLYHPYLFLSFVFCLCVLRQYFVSWVDGGNHHFGVSHGELCKGPYYVSSIYLLFISCILVVVYVAATHCQTLWADETLWARRGVVAEVRSMAHCTLHSTAHGTAHSTLHGTAHCRPPRAARKDRHTPLLYSSALGSTPTGLFIEMGQTDTLQVAAQTFSLWCTCGTLL